MSTLPHPPWYSDEQLINELRAEGERLARERVDRAVLDVLRGGPEQSLDEVLDELESHFP